jgi:hypothetical protein
MRRPRFRWFGISLLIGLVVAGACTPSENHAESCSNGPAWPQTTIFEVDNSVTSHLECTPRCAWSGREIDGIRTLDALPSGPCTVNGDTCSMGVTFICECAGPKMAGPTHGFFCSCETGQWACKIASQGAGVCGCHCGGKTILTLDGKYPPECDGGASDAGDGSAL